MKLNTELSENQCEIQIFYQMKKILPSATPQGYCLPLTLLPLTSMIVLLPTTARGKRSYKTKYSCSNISL